MLEVAAHHIQLQLPRLLVGRTRTRIEPDSHTGAPWLKTAAERLPSEPFGASPATLVGQKLERLSRRVGTGRYALE